MHISCMWSYDYGPICNSGVKPYHARMVGRRKTVCIVDDEPSVRRALSRMIGLHGFETWVFGSARDCLDDAYLTRASCLLIDASMSGIDGFELLTLLRASGRNIPTVIMSAHIDMKYRDRAKSVGAIEFLQKPCTEAALMGAIDRAIAAKPESDYPDNGSNHGRSPDPRRPLRSL